MNEIKLCRKIIDLNKVTKTKKFNCDVLSHSQKNSSYKDTGCFYLPNSRDFATGEAEEHLKNMYVSIWSPVNASNKYYSNILIIHTSVRLRIFLLKWGILWFYICRSTVFQIVYNGIYTRFVIIQKANIYLSWGWKMWNLVAMVIKE